MISCPAIQPLTGRSCSRPQGVGAITHAIGMEFAFHTKGKFHPDRMRYRTHSLWTRERSACQRLRISFNVPDNEAPSISTDTKGLCLARASSTFLHRLAQDRASAKLMALPDQGKVARALIKDAFSNGSSWLFNGLNMRFKDWRFIHHARLNVDCSTLCRVCNSHPETLPHIICHCNTHLVQIRERHNTVVERLKKAVRYGSVCVDQQVPGVDDEWHPDILIDEGCEVTIIDVTCPYENGDDVLATADYNKLIKYDHLKQ